MKITDEMIEVANRAVIEKRGYKYPGLFTDEELRIGRENMKVALEAAFAAVPVEPVAWRHRISGTEKWGVSIEGDPVLRNARRFAEQYPENAEIEPLYAAPTAPAVVVKPLAPADVYKVLKRWHDAGQYHEDYLAMISREISALVPQDVINLVIAAREVAYSDPEPETLRALDKAVEAFAERVPWDDDPDSLVVAPNGGANG